MQQLPLFNLKPISNRLELYADYYNLTKVDNYSQMAAKE